MSSAKETPGLPEMWQPISLSGKPVDVLENFPPPDFVPSKSRLPGIDVYVPASAVEKRPEVVDFKCPHCGATTAYSVEKSGLACEYCGYTEPVEQDRPVGQKLENFEFRVDTVERAQKGWGSQRKELACQRCGGVVSTPPDAIAFACPFCGSNKVIFRETFEDVLRPRFMIPFTIDPQGCREITRKWLGSSWMVPGDLRRAAGEGPQKFETFHPLYIPYWSFQATTQATWRAMVAHTTTEVYYVKGERQERQQITWREENGKVQKSFGDLFVPGTGRLTMKTLGQVDNYDARELVLYEPRYLAGMQAQAYDIPLEEAWDAARKIIRDRTRQTCLDRASGSQVRGFRMTMDFNDEAWRYLLAPIYTGVYRYRDEVYQILVNGQTGRIAGPRPVDWQKFWLVVAGILTPGALVTLLGFLLGDNQTGSLTLVIGIMLLVIGVVVSFFQLKQAEEMENG
jgi:predicted RNA-binding Zn-ribbon protein involved in translation (DUF1610 family)